MNPSKKGRASNRMARKLMNGRLLGWNRALPAAGLLALAALLPGCVKEPPGPAKAPPPEVLVSTPVTGEITDFEDFTGRTQAVRTVEVRARVTGYLDKVNFKDGIEVEEGDLLFVIDPRPYRAELNRTEALLVQTEARTKRLEADFRRAKATFNRGAISREEFDAKASDYAEASAAVGSARANRDLAALNLDFTRVIAPISGRISRRMVDEGNLVQADVTALTSIVSVDPMYVYFDIDERTLLRIRRLIREGKVHSRTEAEVPVMAALADEEDFPHEGMIDFSDNQVDPSTGTLRVRAVIPNPANGDGKARVLSPGLFIRVRLPIGNPRKALLVAEQAMGTDQGRKFVYVVNDQDEVTYRPVKTGTLDHGMRVIEEGLTLEDRVVVTGLQRIRPGAKVVPKSAKDIVRSDRDEDDQDAKPSTVAVADTAESSPADARPAQSPKPPR